MTLFPLPLRWLVGLFWLLAAQGVTACPTNLNHTLLRLQDEKPQSLCQYAGKVILAVNTASYCGFTRQYKGLEELWRRYRDKGLVVLGVPSNDFGGQEPGTADEISAFCTKNYGVTFTTGTQHFGRTKDNSMYEFDGAIDKKWHATFESRGEQVAVAYDVGVLVTDVVAQARVADLVIECKPERRQVRVDLQVAIEIGRAHV